MSEGEIFSQVRKSSKIKRKSNYERSKKILDERGIKYIEKPNGQLIIGDWNIWLTTGLFIHKKTGKKGRGIFSFLQKIK